MHIGHVMCLKKLITAAFENSEWFHNVKACIVGVSVPSLHRESTESVRSISYCIRNFKSYMYKHLYTPILTSLASIAI